MPGPPIASAPSTEQRRVARPAIADLQPRLHRRRHLHAGDAVERLRFAQLQAELGGEFGRDHRLVRAGVGDERIGARRQPPAPAPVIRL